MIAQLDTQLQKLGLETVNPPRPVTPLGILVQHLQTAKQLLENQANIAAIAEQVQQALKLAVGLDPYLEACTTLDSAPLCAIAAKTAAESWQQRFHTGETVRPLEQEMLSGQVEGQFLKLIVQMIGAKRILDIGMFTGYSALAMAEALPAEGYVVACEVDPYVAGFAQELFQQSDHGHKIRVHLAPALETLENLANAQEWFELVFIDADKQEYSQYFHRLLDWNLVCPQGLICVDNTLFQGQVYLPEEERSPNGQAIAEFNQVVAADPRVEQVLLPLRDGLTIIRRK